MNLDEFAFFNQQLAGMLQSGIPLEAALRQLSAEMGKGSLRAEIEALERDLAKGRPLGEAISTRKLPPLYVQMLKLGVAGNNLPAMLNLLADYYHRANSVWMRLKTLLVYPGIVLLASLALSVAMAMIYGSLTREVNEASGQMFPGQMGLGSTFGLIVSLWYPVALIGLLFLLFVAVWTLPQFRNWLRWRIPAFKEASLSQIASGIALMLQNGGTFNQTLELAVEVEAGSPAARELALWRKRLAEGRTQFSDLSAGGKFFPPLFVWLVSGSGEDWASGFKNAADVYYQRAVHKVELMLYAVLPVTILALGILIVSQVAPIGQVIAKPMQYMVEIGE